MRARGSSQFTLAVALLVVIGCSSPGAFENTSTTRGATVGDPGTPCEKPCDKYRSRPEQSSPFVPEFFYDTRPRDRIGMQDYTFQSLTLSVCADAQGVVVLAESKRRAMPSQPDNPFRLSPESYVVRFGYFHLAVETTPESFPVFARILNEHGDGGGLNRLVVRGNDTLLNGFYDLVFSGTGLVSGWVMPGTSIDVRPETDVEYRFTASKSGRVVPDTSQWLPAFRLYSGQEPPT